MHREEFAHSVTFLLRLTPDSLCHSLLRGGRFPISSFETSFWHHYRHGPYHPNGIGFDEKKEMSRFEVVSICHPKTLLPL